jgi:hypothetical protein
VINRLRIFAILCVVAPAVVGVAAQEPAPPRAKETQAPLVPHKVQVVISRSLGEKKISNAPYTVTITPQVILAPGSLGPSAGSLRLGTRIPILHNAAPGGSDGKPGGSFSYQDVGTNIDVRTWPLDNGAYRVEVSVDDSSVYQDDQGKTSTPFGLPTLRSFRANDSIVLRDGQTTQLTTATDRITGETIRVDVTLTVVK